MRRIAWALLLLGGTVLPTRAHFVPIPPSLCAFEPVGLDVPTMGLAGTARAAATDDTMRLLYDIAANVVEVCADPAGDLARCGTPVARPFTLGSATGTLTFPPLFIGSVLSSGDVIVSYLPLALTLGGVTITPRVAFTTGLAAVDGEVVEGAPVQGFGSLTLVGVVGGDAFPPPFTGRSLVLTLACPPRPVPDMEQFAAAPAMGAIGGHITTTAVQLRTTVEIFPPASPPDFTHGPILVAVHVDGNTIATAVVSAGLQGRRRLTGTSDDGKSVVEVRLLSSSRFALDLHLGTVTLPPQHSGAPVLVDVTLDGGGLLGRGEQLFRTGRSGRQLRSR